MFGGMKVNGENVNRSDNFNFLFAAYGKNEVTDTVLPKINKPGNLGDRVLAVSPALAALAACALLYISKAKRQF